jgi:glutamyl-Q tRNA(Asp) synthetase
MRWITRFAPSPTGPLHLGHALSAACGLAVARASGGEWRLRIDDLDTARARPHWTAAIDTDLAWLGFVPDGPVMKQSERAAAHHRALASLATEGLVYACTCTRSDIAAAVTAPHGAVAVYPGTCRGRYAAPLPEPHALRLDMATAVARAGDPEWTDLYAGPQPPGALAAGDVVLRRRDGAVAYMLATPLDDAAQGVTLVTRGQDLLEATPVQALLARLLGLPPVAYLHHHLIVDDAGRRLAKRDGAPGLREGRNTNGGAALAADLLRRCAPYVAAAVHHIGAKGPQ